MRYVCFALMINLFCAAGIYADEMKSVLVPNSDTQATANAPAEIIAPQDNCLNNNCRQYETSTKEFVKIRRRWRGGYVLRRTTRTQIRLLRAR